MKQIDAPTLRGWIEDGRELAILDAREEGEFAAGHLYGAISCRSPGANSAVAPCCRAAPRASFAWMRGRELRRSWPAI